jgi:hypothetical protein
MNLSLTELNRKLIAAARSNVPSDHVPYAFEKRILARLHQPVKLDDWALWSRALWRAAAPCVAVMLLFSAWASLAPVTREPATHAASTDLSQDLENTLLAATDSEQPAESLW